MDLTMSDRTDHTEPAENDILQCHSEIFLEMAFRNDHSEVLQHPDGMGHKPGDCGDSISFYLLVRDRLIHHAAYDINGCIHTNACANAIVELIQGKTADQAWEINPDDVARYLETLPPDHFHCAELAVGALYLALADLRDNQIAPWKKSYR